MENKKDRQCDAAEARRVVPLYFFPEIEDRENREDRQSDDFLNGLELRCAEFIGANAVRRDLEAILEKSDAPADQDNLPECGGAELQVAVPGEGHEDIRNGEQDDRSHVSRSLLLVKGFLCETRHLWMKVQPADRCSESPDIRAIVARHPSTEGTTRKRIVCI